MSVVAGRGKPNPRSIRATFKDTAKRAVAPSVAVRGKSGFGGLHLLPREVPGRRVMPAGTSTRSHRPSGSGHSCIRKRLLRMLVATLVGTLLREVSAVPPHGNTDVEGITRRQDALEGSGLPAVVEAAPHLARFEGSAEFDFTVNLALDAVLARLGTCECLRRSPPSRACSGPAQKWSRW
jgi:hypothetical protein